MPAGLHTKMSRLDQFPGRPFGTARGECRRNYKVPGSSPGCSNTMAGQ